MADEVQKSEEVKKEAQAVVTQDASQKPAEEGKRVLGRGLDALIPPKAAESVLAEAVSKVDAASDEELRRVFALIDDLLGKLPDNVIEEFSKSKDFELYDRILKKYGL